MAKKRWQYKHGPHGATVTVEERRVGSPVLIKCWDASINGTRERSLKFRVRDAEGELMEEQVKRAKSEAIDLSNQLIKGESPKSRLTMKELVKLFRKEKLRDLEGQHASDTKRAMEAWEEFLGPRFKVDSFDVAHWNAFARERESGEIDSDGTRVRDPGDREPVSPRTVVKDLKVLRQLCRFATHKRSPDGSFLLETDPTRGLEMPKTPDPSRPVATDQMLERLLSVADEIQTRRNGKMVRSYLRELLVLAAGTGRRIGAMVRLRYSDWFPEEGRNGVLRWRADSDKLGKEWRAPVTSRVRRELEEIQRDRPGIGDAWLFPAPMSDGPMNVTLASTWLRRAEERAGLWEERERPDRFGWHAFRRMWATKRKELPAADVAAVGGWKGTQVLENVYQRADAETMERVVNHDRPLQEMG